MIGLPTVLVDPLDVRSIRSTLGRAGLMTGIASIRRGAMFMSDHFSESRYNEAYRSNRLVVSTLAPLVISEVRGLLSNHFASGQCEVSISPDHFHEPRSSWCLRLSDGRNSSRAIVHPR